MEKPKTEVCRLALTCTLAGVEGGGCTDALSLLTSLVFKARFHGFQGTPGFFCSSTLPRLDTFQQNDRSRSARLKRRAGVFPRKVRLSREALMTLPMYK